MKYSEWLIANGHSSLVYVGIINRLPTYLNKPTKEALYQHVLDLKQRYSVEYTNLNIKAIKSYLRYRGLNIDLPKLSQPIRRLPDSITREYFEGDIVPLLEDIFPKPLKIKALLYFMFYTGVRQSEMFPIERNDIDLTTCVAKIYEKKTKKERLLVFPKRVKKILIEYFNSEPEKRNAFNIGKYSIFDIFKTLKPYFPDINIRPHLFRHSFATHLLRNGIDISIVSKLLGHKVLRTTMRYLQTNITLIREIYNNKIK